MNMQPKGGATTKYGYFDDARREYVIDRVDTPMPWTNYIGVGDMCAVLDQTAGGYSFYKSPQYHRITRFRPNAPISLPGHYVYLRDDASGDYWSISWQPVGKPLDQARYACRHGLSYSRYTCAYGGIEASQTVFIPVDDPVEIWDVVLRNTGAAQRRISVYSYVEWSFHQIDMDNQNFQMSLYASGASCADGIIENDLHYERDGFQWFGASFEPDGFDTVRSRFLGDGRDEHAPAGVVRGACGSSQGTTGNHCAVLQKRVTLRPGESARLFFYLGEGSRETGRAVRARYRGAQAVDRAFAQLRAYWDKKCGQLQVDTPNPGMNTSLNIWNLYQSEVNIQFSRFASFIEVGGRTGLGYRDTAQDAMMVLHSNPQKCRARIVELLRGLTAQGYGLHLFQPEWFDPARQDQPAQFQSPTVVPTPSRKEIVHGIRDACSDDALWLVPTIAEYIRETGETGLLEQPFSYADGGQGTVLEHMARILDFSTEHVGPNGICLALRADWNDCLNMGGGESAMVTFLHYWALTHFIDLCRHTGRAGLAEKYQAVASHIKAVADSVLWDGGWYIRGITREGRRIGTAGDRQGRVHMESNTWAVFSGVAGPDRGKLAMDAVDRALYTEYGLMLNAPAYTSPDDSIGFVTRVYPGVKENGSIFSHPNPWAWCAEARLGRGSRAMKFYNALLPYNQNDRIEVRKAEPYSYCQFVMGKDHPLFGQANHPFMTGSGGWAYFAATHWLLGVRPQFDSLLIDPCIPAGWPGFRMERVWRGASFSITVKNPDRVEKGVRRMELDGKPAARIPVQAPGSAHTVVVTMGPAD